MNFIRSSSETMTSFQATLVNTGFGQLVLRDSLGKVAHKWTLSNPKCVIGTGTNCNVSCALPGLADHHVLMVIGAKQVFMRALAPGLTRHGQNISELVIPGSETEFNFEIAGHHFQFARDGITTPITKEFVQESDSARPLFAPAYNDAPSSSPMPVHSVQPTASTSASTSPLPTSAAASKELALTPSRLKFTVVRALEKNRQAHGDRPSMFDGRSQQNHRLGLSPSCEMPCAPSRRVWTISARRCRISKGACAGSALRCAKLASWPRTAPQTHCRSHNTFPCSRPS